ncbi:MAG: hypothetical protein DRJ40_11500 [Thermoprotei archaeon]|nr:MAG: hypothetical protein DRJ40_11500 [Thermoprotei archaeon]
MKVSFRLDPNNPADRALINYLNFINAPKAGLAVHELLRRLIMEKCMNDPEWKHLYCSHLRDEPITVRVKA